MDKVKHCKFGIGEVIGKETKGDFTFIVVRFESGKELKFAIPESFETGLIEAVGSFNEEVEKIYAERVEKIVAAEIAKAAAIIADEEERSKEPTTKKHSSKHPKKDRPTGPVVSAFEKYLIEAGYAEETDEGAPSTVYAYSKAVDTVASRENLSWEDLENEISDIVDKYDVGGTEEKFGEKSNKTVINALKRFKEFSQTT